MKRPWWALAILVPVCCGSKFLMLVFGVSGTALLGTTTTLQVPPILGAVLFGTFLGIAVAMMILMFAVQATERPACAQKATASMSTHATEALR